MPRLFVYGTLQRGDMRASALAGQAFLGTGWTQPLYRLYDCGEYPALVETQTGGRPIRGEVYDVTPQQLLALDEIEGVAENLYARRVVRLEPPWKHSPVEAYLYLPDVAGLPECGDRWEPRINSGSAIESAVESA